jgi:hypothetical protein
MQDMTVAKIGLFASRRCGLMLRNVVKLGDRDIRMGFRCVSQIRNVEVHPVVY